MSVHPVLDRVFAAFQNPALTLQAILELIEKSRDRLIRSFSTSGKPPTTRIRPRMAPRLSSPYFRYARTRPIRSSASSAAGIEFFSSLNMCRRMWSSRTSAMRLKFNDMVYGVLFWYQTLPAPLIGVYRLQFTFGDNALVYVQNNGVNSVSIDLPNYTPGNLQINHNPRNGLPYFNTSLFAPNALGTQGNAKRRFFYGPGINNFDVALRKITRLTETKSLEFRFETFNTFNHPQFYPNGSVDGNINSPTFGQVLKAAPQRIGQVALKLTL